MGIVLQMKVCTFRCFMMISAICPPLIVTTCIISLDSISRSVITVGTEAVLCNAGTEFMLACLIDMIACLQNVKMTKSGA
jgi:hypothetical protein